MFCYHPPSGMPRQCSVITHQVQVKTKSLNWKGYQGNVLLSPTKWDAKAMFCYHPPSTSQNKKSELEGIPRQCSVITHQVGCQGNVLLSPTKYKSKQKV